MITAQTLIDWREVRAPGGVACALTRRAHQALLSAAPLTLPPFCKLQ